MNAELVAACVLSTFSLLCYEILGRANFGQGLLKTQTHEIASLPVLGPEMIPTVKEALLERFGVMSERSPLMLYDDVHQPDRIALDDAFLEAVGFDDPAERAALVKELHDAACRMIWNRMAKTDNARESRMTYDEWLATGEPFGEVPEEDEGEE